jgi:serine/threonine protein kinase
MNNDDQLADLFVRWKAARSRGEAPTPEEICREFPELLAEFRGRLPAFAAIDGLFEGTEVDAPVMSGQEHDLDGYCSLRLHKQGGLGLVFEAEDVELHRRVAIKRMKTRATLTPGAKEQFINEAEITARLDHPGVVPIYRGGHDQAGQPYYAMRFVEGATLADAIERHYSSSESALNSAARNVEFRRLLGCLVTVCKTIAYAHDRGVLHRDLKPENVMLGSFGEVIVIDWGLAKRFRKQHQSEAVAQAEEAATTCETTDQPNGHTVLGSVKGSPAYMSPEQADGDWPNVGPASDIYSLGATLYVLLTGQPPYTGETVLGIINKVKAGPCTPPEQLNRSVSKSLAAICNQAMSRSREVRYRSAQEMASDLERWLADEPVTAWSDPVRVRARRWLKRHYKLATSPD